jgi:hypothetical protein
MIIIRKKKPPAPPKKSRIDEIVDGWLEVVDMQENWHIPHPTRKIRQRDGNFHTVLDKSR